MFTLNELRAQPSLKLRKNEYASRLQRFWEKLADNSVAIIVSNPERTRSNDTEHNYRQSSDLLYLNGFPEAQSALVITKLRGKYRQRRILFVLPKDRSREIWTGIRVGTEGAVSNYLAHEAHTVDKFSAELSGLLQKAQHVYYRFGINEEFDEQFRKLWQSNERDGQKPLLDPLQIVHEMRLFKSEAELKIMQRAGDISAIGHCAAMEATRPGMGERQLQAILEGTFMYLGAGDVAYGSIVANGNNGVVLHYTSNSDMLRDGDLVLVDAACEYHGYASDITRTWPVNGKFGQAQREIYQLVLDAQVAAIKAVRPGVKLQHIHLTAERVLREGLKRLGILPADNSAKTEQAGRRLRKKAEKAGQASGDQPKALELYDFFMHGTSHWMGLDVHDVGSYDPADGKPTKLRKQRKLEPGMVFTAEPGLYFDKNDTRVPEQYRGIGVRIEDDVVVTADGCHVLTAGVPKTVEDIERLMSGSK